MENIKLPDLAAFLRVSSRQASRIVKQAYGVSYTTMLTEYRVQKAKLCLLQSPEKELGQVGSECGFQSYTYFITCFRKAVGYTPTDYRKRYALDKDSNDLDFSVSPQNRSASQITDAFSGVDDLS